MARHYDSTLAGYGLTGEQYWRVVAAHELAHGLVAAMMPSLDVAHIAMVDDPMLGAHGGAVVRLARKYRVPEPMEYAATAYAGAVAAGRWLRDHERLWSNSSEQLVYQTTSGDRAAISRLRLDPAQLAAAQQEAVRAVDRQWSAIAAAVPRLAKRGRLSGRELRRLAR